MKIFIQIASYRDPQLVPTLKDMIANAKKPKNLVFAIARQFNETDGFDNLDEYRNDKRFKILDIPYQEAQGVCWARNLTQQLYDGETYTLQIDSHMICINQTHTCVYLLQDPTNILNFQKEVQY